MKALICNFIGRYSAPCCFEYEPNEPCVCLSFIVVGIPWFDYCCVIPENLIIHRPEIVFISLSDIGLIRFELLETLLELQILCLL